MRNLNENKWKSVKAWMMYFMLFLAIHFYFGGVFVAGNSMNPTLQDAQIVFVVKRFLNIQRQDIITFTATVEANTRKRQTFIKRVIAVEGDEVDIDFESGSVYVNGELLIENYIAEKTFTDFGATMPQIVPQGHVFVLGDNRNFSLDSRSSEIGMVSLEQVTGIVVFQK